MFYRKFFIVLAFGQNNKAIKAARTVQRARISTGGLFPTHSVMLNLSFTQFDSGKAPTKQLASKHAKKPLPQGGFFSDATTSPSSFGGPTSTFGFSDTNSLQFGGVPSASSVPPSISGFGGPSADSWGSPVPPSSVPQVLFLCIRSCLLVLESDV